MQEENHKSLSIPDCPSPELLQKYLMNTLDDREKHTLERHAIGCELCSDAIDGFVSSGQSNVLTENKNLKKRVDEFFGSSKRQKEKIAVWAAAASFILIIGATIVFFFSANKKNNFTSSSQEPSYSKPVPNAILKNNDDAIATLPLVNNADKNLESPEANSSINQLSSKAEDKTDKKEKSEVSELADKTSDANEAYLIPPAAPAVMSNAESEKAKSAFSMDEVKNEMLVAAEDHLLSFANKDRGIELREIANSSAARKKTKTQRAPAKLKNLSDSTSASGMINKENDKYLHAIETYERKDFRHSAELFEDLEKKDPENFKYLVYAILSNVRNGKNSDALRLTEHINEKSSEMVAYRKWLTALALLANDPDNSIKLLKEVSEEKNIFQQESLRILQALK